MRNSKLILLLFIFIVTGLSCGEEPILIGFSGSLTGIYSDLGVQGRNGATLAIEDINAKGGVAGRKLKLIPKDDAGLPERAKKVDQELIEKGVVAIIGHMTSSQTMAALPVAEKAGTVMISPTTSTPKLSGKKDLFFRVQASLDQQAKGLALYARKDLGLSRISLVWDADNQAYSEPYKENFIQAFEQGQGEICGQCQFSSNLISDRGSIIDCLDQDNPQGILIIASARDTAHLVQSIKEHHLSTKLFASGWAATNSLLVQGGRKVEGLYLGRSKQRIKQGRVYQEFANKYNQRFGKKPSFAAVQSYTAIQLLAKALEKTGGSRKGLPQTLIEVKDFSSLCQKCRLNEFGDLILPVSILKVSKGSFIQVKKIQAINGSKSWQ
jgi:branched-chain amino acid transport system substrate-binding protein